MSTQKEALSWLFPPRVCVKPLVWLIRKRLNRCNNALRITVAADNYYSFFFFNVLIKLQTNKVHAQSEQYYI